MVNTADQYLKAIYLIQSGTDEPAATGAIADHLHVSPASATEMIGKLEERDLLVHEKYKGVTLTEAGAEQARNTLQTYCIIERFLFNVLGVEEFTTEARELESVIDDTVADRLDTIIDRDGDCPDCFDVDADACGLLEAILPAEERQASD